MNLKTKKYIASKKSITPAKNRQKFLKLLAKIIFTALAVFFVVKKIDVGETIRVLSQLHFGWVLLAVLFFNLSKVISAYRLLTFLRVPAIDLSGTTGIKLCYVGMFYNLFLPGGIGGDGYKVYLLKKSFKDHSLKKIISAALLDRISGMVALVFLALVVFSFTSVSYYLSDLRYNFAYFIGIAFFYPLAYMANHIFFRSFKNAFLLTSLQSLGVQTVQLASALFILLALGIHDHQFDYLQLFLISSVVVVLPVTVGGIGARELVFVYGYQFLLVEKHTAVAFSVVFLAITVISSLPGIFLKVEPDLQKTADMP